MDHRPAIRAQIERDVHALVKRFRGPASYGPDPTHIELGYTTAVHRGVDLYPPGAQVLGLPIEIDPTRSHLIAVAGHGDREAVVL